MDNKKRLVLIILILVLLIGGAYVLYERMSSQVTSQQLVANEAPAASEKPDVSPAVTENEEEAEVEDENTQSNMAPDFTVLDMDGNEVNLYDYLGKPIVLNFWASWCGVCTYGLPTFVEAHSLYGEEINFLMVNLTDGNQETLESAKNYIAENEYSLPFYFDTKGEAAYFYGVYSIPTTYFIGANGEAIARASGALNMDTMHQGIDLIMAQ